MSESYLPNAKPCGCPLWMDCDHKQPEVSIKGHAFTVDEAARTKVIVEAFQKRMEDERLVKVEKTTEELARENARLKREVERANKKKRFNVTVDRSEKKSSSGTTGGGISIGTVVAIMLSWSINHSIAWAIVHGMFGWFYVVYYLFGGGR